MAGNIPEEGESKSEQYLSLCFGNVVRSSQPLPELHPDRSSSGTDSTGFLSPSAPPGTEGDGVGEPVPPPSGSKGPHRRVRAPVPQPRCPHPALPLGTAAARRIFQRSEIRRWGRQLFAVSACPWRCLLLGKVICQALGLVSGTATVVWGREQGTATPVENQQRECSKDGDPAADSPVPSVGVALSVGEMAFQSRSGQTSLLSKEQAAGMLQLGL